MIACYVTHHVYIAYTCISHSFLTLTINNNISFLSWYYYIQSWLSYLHPDIANPNLKTIRTMSCTRVYPYPGYEKRLKSISGLTRHMNAFKSQIIQQVFLIHMILKEDMPMPGENNKPSDNFGPYQEKEFTPEAQDTEKDHRDVLGKSSDTKSHTKVGQTPQNRLLRSESSLSLKEVRFSK